MNLQIAQLFSAANPSLSVDGVSSQPEILSQLSTASVQRIGQGQLQISASQLLTANLVTPSPSTTAPASPVAATSGEKQLTLFDMLPVRQSVTLTQADTQRLVTALADGMALAALSPSKNGFNLTGTVESIANRTLSLNLQMPGNPGVKLTVPDSVLSQLQTGAQVTLKLQPALSSSDITQQLKNSTGQQWTATITNRVLPQKEVSFPVSSSSPTVKLAVAKAIASSGITLEQALSPILQKNLSIPSSSSTGKSPPASMHIVNVMIRGNQLEVRGSELKPVLNITLPADAPKLLLAADVRLTELASQKTVPRQPGMIAAAASSGNSDSRINQSGNSVPANTADKSPAATTTAQEVVNTPEKLTATHGISVEELPVVAEKIRQISRQLLAQTGSTNEALSKLVNILRNPGIDLHGETKNVSKQLISQFLAIQPETKAGPAALVTPMPGTEKTEADPGKTADSQIRQLLQAPALTTTPTALLSPPSSSGFINALVSLLQISLAGRAARTQPDLARIIDKAESVTARTISASGGSSSGAQPARVAGDFAQLDSRTNLLEQVRSLLANHQQQKVQSAETRLQGQDTMFYVLPVSNDDQPPPELHLRSEERDSRDNTAERGKQRIWHLTMKLSVGETGDMLAKTKITDDTIELRIYTSSDALLTSVVDLLPYLIRRLESQGLTVEHHSCQRGKIPKTMKDMPYHLFEALA